MYVRTGADHVVLMKVMEWAAPTILATKADRTGAKNTCQLHVTTTGCELVEAEVGGDGMTHTHHTLL